MSSRGGAAQKMNAHPPSDPGVAARKEGYVGPGVPRSSGLLGARQSPPVPSPCTSSREEAFLHYGAGKGAKRNVNSMCAEAQGCGWSFCEVVEIINMCSRKTQAGWGGSSEKGQKCRLGCTEGPRLPAAKGPVFQTFPSTSGVEMWR